jgi:hypothetical protein
MITTVHWPSREKYEGDFVYGKRQGKDFTHGHLDKSMRVSSMGVSVMVTAPKLGSIYTGNWEKDKMDGRWVMNKANGDVYDGNLSNGLPYRSGVFRYAKREIYVGTWVKGLKDGKGTSYYPYGSKQASQQNKWCTILRKSIFYLCPSEKALVSGRSKSLCHSSHRISPLDANWSLQNQVGDCICRDSSSTLPQPTDDGRSEALSISYMVVEREYMQGVRIKERIRQHSKITHNKNDKQDQFSVKQVKKSSRIRTFFLKIVKSII